MEFRTFARLTLTACLVLPATICTAYASPIAYSFTGTMSGSSFLELPSGELIDVGGAQFTVSGITNGDPLFLTATSILFPSISVWDFGELGSFVANAPDEYFALRRTEDGVIYAAGLRRWREGSIDFLGFYASIPGFGENMPVSDTEFGGGVLPGKPASLKINEDSLLRPLRITSATVQEVPEPSTLALVLLSSGVTSLFLRRRT